MLRTLFAALALVVVLFFQVTPVLAAGCSTQTLSYQGRMVTCTTCCWSANNCNTTCF